jgi:hypothetical protein
VRRPMSQWRIWPLAIHAERSVTAEPCEIAGRHGFCPSKRCALREVAVPSAVDHAKEMVHQKYMARRMPFLRNRCITGIRVSPFTQR